MTVTAWTVMLRGIRYRAGRSIIVWLLGVIATSAAVLAPAYSRAATQSVLTDALRSAPSGATSLVIGATGTAAAVPAAHRPIRNARAAVTDALGRYPVISRLIARGIGGVDTNARIDGPVPLGTRFAYRDNVCGHVLLIAGSCPEQAGEILISQRAATGHGMRVGQRLTLRLGGATTDEPRTFTITGLYTPRDATEPYWGSNAYFTDGAAADGNGTQRIDAIFAGDEEDVRLSEKATLSLRVEYPLDVAAVRLDDVAPLRAEFDSFALAIRSAELEVVTALPDILRDIDEDQHAISRTIPVIAVPLALLCWFVLFLLVASLTEERGPEIALAKLRGYPAGRVAQFGLGEVLVLLAIATPVGIAAGLGVVELAARLTLASGTHVELRWPVLAAAALALLAAVVAAVLAARRTLRRGVLALLRWVPQRMRWQAGVAEGLVVALAGASLFAAINDRTSPLSLLAPALLAVVAGVVCARLLGIWARLRLVAARRLGQVPALLSAAQLARRSASHRVVVVVTIAVALLAFAATAWDVSAQARRDTATDAVGASRVLTVTAPHPRALVDGLAKADPSGRSMAVVRLAGTYSQRQVELVGVQSPRLAAVAVWRGEDRAAIEQMAAKLRPSVADPLIVKNFIEIDLDVRSLGGAAPPRLSALVSAPGEPPRGVSLGVLLTGGHTYRGVTADCPSGCRLLGLALAPGASGAQYATTFAIRALRSANGPLEAHLDTADAWRFDPARVPRASVTLQPGAVLTATVTSADQGDVLLEYADAPAELPVVLAGSAPAEDPNAGRFAFPGFGEAAQAFTVAQRTPRLPRVGTYGLLFDLDYAVRLAERTTSLADSSQLRYEVWAAADAPADLGDRLIAAGLPVLRTESIAGYVDQLGRRAPALGLRLYVLAGGVAVALAIGVVMLTAYVGADGRLYELAALRVTGVRGRLLRRSVLREYFALLALPVVVGFAVGAAGALLMLPGIPLVTAGAPVNEVTWRPGPGVLPVALGVTVLGLLVTVAVVLRLLRRATPDRLREAR